MNQKLSFEEWQWMYWGKVTMAEDLKAELRQLHNIDADQEIENVMRTEYQSYLIGGSQ
jgi:hypothetical protein